jgi:hypothetical protein
MQSPTYEKASDTINIYAEYAGGADKDVNVGEKIILADVN